MSGKYFLKKLNKLILILSLVSIPVYLLSAFEASVVNVTARICSPSETHTIGYWKNHSSVYENCLPQNLGDELIDTVEKADYIFKNANADYMPDMLKAQLLAMKFNIACLGINDSEGEKYHGKTLEEIVAQADGLLSQHDPEPTREELEYVKNILDGLNNLPYIKYCSTLPSWFSSISSSGDDFGPELLTAAVNPNNSEEELPPEEPPADEPPADEPPVEEPPPYEPECGNGILDEGEECDDNNLDNEDGCSSACVIEEPPAEEPPPEEPPPYEPECGNSILDEGEECDDGNLDNEDGCSSVCVIEEPPAEEPPPYEPECGNGILDEGEECDDGNLDNEDGCSSTCSIEPPPYEPVCGNSILDEGEECDDNNLDNEDGCSSTCSIEPPPYEPVCGNSILDDTEECDDGNTEDGDGCSSACTIEEPLEEPPPTE